MKKLGGYFVLRKQGLTEKTKGKHLAEELCAFDGEARVLPIS